jgi:hypothetical protein
MEHMEKFLLYFYWVQVYAVAREMILNYWLLLSGPEVLIISNTWWFDISLLGVRYYTHWMGSLTWSITVHYIQLVCFCNFYLNLIFCCQIRGLAWPAVLVGWVAQSARWNYIIMLIIAYPMLYLLDELTVS